MIKVFSAKELIKYCIRFIIPIIVIWILISKITNVKADEKITNNNVFFSCLDDTFEKMKDTNEENINLVNIISKQMKIFQSIKKMDSSKNENTNDNVIETQNNNDNQKETNNNVNNESKPKLAKENVTTEVIKNNVNPRYTNEYQGVKINNQTEYNLTDDMLNTDTVNVNKKKVVIYHTHTCESYTPSEKYNYVQTGNFRTQDLNYSVVKVGDELEERLRDYGIDVIHDKTCHDYPSYNGSYSRSLKTAEIIKSENKDADIYIDLHRDAIADSSYAPKVKIGDEYASQLMFVVGSDVANKINSNWNDNFKFAIKVQKKANELYNGLFKPIILRNSEYNGHISKACVIIEVGSTGNTLDESINSMKYLAKILSEF